jgi:hypothetical protein
MTSRRSEADLTVDGLELLTSKQGGGSSKGGSGQSGRDVKVVASNPNRGCPKRTPALKRHG